MPSRTLLLSQWMYKAYIVGKLAQDLGMAWKYYGIIPPCLVGFWGFHPNALFISENFLWLYAYHPLHDIIFIIICIDGHHTVSLYSMPIAIYYKTHLCQFAVDCLMLHVLYRHTIPRIFSGWLLLPWWTAYNSPEWTEHAPDCWLHCHVTQIQKLTVMGILQAHVEI